MRALVVMRDGAPGCTGTSVLMVGLVEAAVPVGQGPCHVGVHCVRETVRLPGWPEKNKWFGEGVWRTQ